MFNKEMIKNQILEELEKDTQFKEKFKFKLFGICEHNSVALYKNYSNGVKYAKCKICGDIFKYIGEE